MRICMVTYSFYEADNRVMRYAETLAQQGHSVDVVSLRQEGQASDDRIRGVDVFRIQRRIRNETSAWRYLLRIFLFLLRSMVFLTRKHFSSPYNLIHVHSMPDFLVFAAWIPQLTGCPVILDVHDLLPDFFAARFGVSQRSWLYSALIQEERLSAAFSQHVIISNHLWKERIIGRSVQKQKCTVLINAPDRGIFAPRSHARSGDKIIMLYPGSLNYHQGLDVAVRAVGAVRNRLPNLEFHICGAGPEREFLTRLVHELELENRVLFLPARSIHEVAALMCAADIGVVPKRCDSFGNEAFSTKILEFMAVGVPIIASDTKIDRYYFDDSIVKFVRSGDVDSLAEAIVLLAESPTLRETLVRNALQFVQQNDWDSIRHIYLALLADVTGASITGPTRLRQLTKASESTDAPNRTAA